MNLLQRDLLLRDFLLRAGLGEISGRERQELDQLRMALDDLAPH